MIGTALLALGILVGEASAVDPGEVLRLQRLIDRANQLYVGVEVKPGVKYGIVPTRDELKMAENALVRNEARIAGLREELLTMLDEEAALRQQIIDEIKVSYGIKPDNERAPLTSYRFKGSDAKWNPLFGEHATLRVHTTAKGKKVAMVFNEDYDAVTWENGEIVITRTSFRSPGFLAAVIYHETIHFQQITEPDPERAAEKKTRRQLEWRAYLSANDSRFGLTSGEKRAFYQKFQKIISTGDADRVFNPFLGGAGSKVHDEDLEAVRKEAARTRREAAERRKTQHLSTLRQMAMDLCKGVVFDQAALDAIWYVDDRSYYREVEAKFWETLRHAPACWEDRYAGLLSKLGSYGRLQPWMIHGPTAAPLPSPGTTPEAAKPPQPRDIPQAAPPIVPASGERELLSLASKACADPGSLNMGQTPELAWFPAPSVRLFLPKPREQLSPCEQGLWDYLSQRNDKGLALDMNELSQRAWGYQQNRPSRPDVPYNHCIDPGNNCIPGLGR